MKSYYRSNRRMTNALACIRIGKVVKKEKDILSKEEWIRLKPILPKKLQLMFSVLNGSGLRI